MFLAHVGPIQWGDFATWLAGVGTVAAVAVALRQVARERASRIKREQQDQSDRHRAHASLISAWLGPTQEIPRANRQSYDNPMDTARHNYRTAIHVHNSSSEPIYDVVAGIVFIQGAAPRTLEAFVEFRARYMREMAEERSRNVGTEQAARGAGPDPYIVTAIVPPGTWCLWLQGSPPSVLSGRRGVDVAFVDRNGTSWIRRAMGQLEELNERPLQHLGPHGLHPPYDYRPIHSVE